MSTPDLDAIRELLDARTNLGSTHWDGCRGAHIDCAARVLLDEVDRLADELVEARKVIDAARTAADQLDAFLDFLGEAGMNDPTEQEHELLGLLSGNGHPEERVFMAAEYLGDSLARWDTFTTVDTFPERCACGRTGPCRHCDDQEGPGFTSE